MPAPTTIDELLELVRKSGVADDKRIEAYVQTLREKNQLPTEPAKFAAAAVQVGLLTNFQAEQLVQGKWKRFNLGKYRVLERLGSGGMGSVFLCEHKFMRRRQAVKVLPTAKAADESSLLRFYREGKAIAAVDHPNIVHAYDIDQDDNLHFIVMEYVDGPSMQEIVRRGGPVAFERACHYISQAALGLEHANQVGLVHRDIKPGNILVDRTGVVKILDLGLARFFNDDEDMLTRQFDENVLGTADYLAPEQADDSHEVDIRADIYSLGGTFYFLLTGRTPFGEGTVPQKLMWHRTRQPKPISTYRNDVPEEVQAIIAKMMSKEPERRFQTPSEITAALAPWTQGPVPPPTEKEMPKLSPAITGIIAGSSSEAGSGARKKSQPDGQMVAPGPTRVAKETPSGKASEGSPQSAPRSPAPARTKTHGAIKPPSTPKLAPAAVTEEENSPWASVAPDTADPSAKGDTPPQTPARTHKTSPVVPMLRRINPRIALLIAAGVLLAMMVMGLVVLGIVLALSGRSANGPQSWTVGKNGQFATVTAALAQAKSGDHIVLLDPEHRERLVWEQQGLTDIQIGPGQGKTVTWLAPPGASEEDALLQFGAAKGFHITGIRLNGERRVRDLIRLSGPSPGLTIENTHLEGFTQAAIVFLSCTGSADRAVQLTGVATTTGGQTAETAILFDSDPRQPAANEHITVNNNCRLEGSFGHGPVWFKKERSRTIIVP